MRVKTIKNTQTEEFIDVELPYYYKHDMSSKSYTYIIYGKIMKDREHAIMEEKGPYKTNYEISSETGTVCDSYLSTVYESSEKEYESAKKRALSFIKDI